MAEKVTVKQRNNSEGRKRRMANLKPWPKGVSGNPAGRPKSRTLSEAYRAWLSRPSEKDPGRTNADAVAEVVGGAALKGDLFAVKEITDRVEGRPRQAIDVAIEERNREMVERAIAALVEQARVSREEAIEQLSTIAPEMGNWIN